MDTFLFLDIRHGQHHNGYSLCLKIQYNLPNFNRIFYNPCSDNNGLFCFIMVSTIVPHVLSPFGASPSATMIMSTHLKTVVLVHISCLHIYLTVAFILHRWTNHVGEAGHGPLVACRGCGRGTRCPDILLAITKLVFGIACIISGHLMTESIIFHFATVASNRC